MSLVPFNNRVLIIDDEEVVRDSIREVLVDANQDDMALEEAAAAFFEESPPASSRSSLVFAFECDEAASGEEGVEKLRRALERGRPYALIFLDIRMLGWDGVETAQRIRGLDQQAEIVFITAYSDHDIEEIVERAGANVGYHCKPFAPEEIRQIATRAVYNWNRLRSLEQLIRVIANLRATPSQIYPLLNNVLHQVSSWVGSNSAAILRYEPKRERFTRVLAIGSFSEEGSLDAVISYLEEQGLPEEQDHSGAVAYFPMGEYTVTVMLQENDEFRTERLYLLRLFIDHAHRAIENASLQEALVRAEKLSMLGRAMSQVLHDLRQPLTIIKGSVQSLRRVQDERRKDLFVDLIERACSDMVHYVNDILDFTRDEPPAPERVDLSAFMMSEVEERARPLLDELGVALEVEVTPDVMADVQANKVLRAVLNLVKNAGEVLQSAGRGDGRVRISLEAPDDEAQIRVADNGPGIPPEILDDLFEPFVSRGKSTGVGLGLAVVRQVCQGHGGDVSVRTSSEGTTFEMRLPLRSLAVASDAADPSDEAPGAAG